MRFLKYTYIIGLLWVYTPSFSQSTKQQQLEEERQRLRAEIKQMKQLRADNQQKERSLLDEVASINAQISTRENLIKITDQQANLLTREINTNLKKNRCISQRA